MKRRGFEYVRRLPSGEIQQRIAEKLNLALFALACSYNAHGGEETLDKRDANHADAGGQ